MYHLRITNRPGLRRRRAARAFVFGVLAGVSLCALLLAILAQFIP